MAILSLALGIGANTAIFTLMDQLMLRRLLVKDPDQLVMLFQHGKGQRTLHVVVLIPTGAIQDNRIQS